VPFLELCNGVTQSRSIGSRTVPDFSKHTVRTGSAQSTHLRVDALAIGRVRPHRIADRISQRLLRVRDLEFGLEAGGCVSEMGCRSTCTKFPASWENTGNFAHFACWEQSNGAECLNKNNHLRENFPAPSNREISGLIRELNWEISHRSGRGLSLGLVGSYVKEDELCGS